MGSGRFASALAGVGITVVALMMRASVAFADPYPGGGQTPPQVKGEQFFHGGPGGTNADTGLKLLMWILLALFLVLAGLILHRVSKRSPARTD